MRLLFVVVIRYASRFEEQAHRLGRLPRGHYGRPSDTEGDFFSSWGTLLSLSPLLIFLSLYPSFSPFFHTPLSDRLVLSMFENLHFLLPTVDMMNEHGSGPILKSYENIMLVIATRLQQAPSDQLSRVFRSLSPPAGAISESHVYMGLLALFPLVISGPG